MNRRSVLIIIICLVCSFALGQKKPSPKLVLKADTSSKIVTGAILDGVKYFIKIIPHDSVNIDHMPTVQPGNNNITFRSVDKEPVPIKRIQPSWPPLNLQKDATVWVRCYIGEDGKVSKSQVIRSDDDRLDDYAINASLHWEFTPAQNGGEPVAVWAAIPFRYVVKK